MHHSAVDVSDALLREAPKADFFDDLSRRWDAKLNLPLLQQRLIQGLREMGIQPHEHVVDVGCGTGNLTAALLAVLGESARVDAVDISRAMIACAQEKINDPRVSWHIKSVMQLPCADSSVDRVLCFQVWPHFDDPVAAATEIRRVLKQGGSLHIWHLDSREKINQIHARIENPVVAADVLASADETARALTVAGLLPCQVSESDQHYMVSAAKP